MPTTLITGTNRGLGLEFTRQLNRDGWRIFACCRAPDQAVELTDLAEQSAGRITVHQLDVTDSEQIDKLATNLAGVGIDLLINNAGMLGGDFEDTEGLGFGRIDYEVWAEVFRTNTMGPLRMVEAFVEHVAMSQRRLLVFISTQMGSMAENDGGYYAYRSSKAALNSVITGLTIDLKDRGIFTVALHPGWVRTDIGTRRAPVGKSDSVAGMLKVIAALTPADSGRFMDYTGAPVPW